MARKVYDQWKIEHTQFNRSEVFYVECDCGELARTAFPKNYFECSECGKRYALHYGDYVEIESKK
ncbi:MULTISPECIES: transcriptional regulator [unclassified Enterococcus]|uniref:transcriptional regulator n=1 Tax=unclassified Enterococcus TaxID=2608891 RepID=UPI001CE1A1A5|nr:MULTISPECIES: transcriptional regulator [unclassified Enterococcus]MCA5014522.1 transcriptional regulator [Enterococcus sp. S23]MCA5017775.1 transcriptional regulator [Enterococcus sp. S22(2020)]